MPKMPKQPKKKPLQKPPPLGAVSGRPSEGARRALRALAKTGGKIGEVRTFAGLGVDPKMRPPYRKKPEQTQ